MGIFFKFIRKSMFEKKGRLFLLILAISLSTALFFTNMGVVDIAIDSIAKPELESCDNKEIRINSKDEESFFEVNDLKEKGIKNLSKEIFFKGLIEDEDESTDVSISARENKYINTRYLLEGSIDDFNGNKCIISKRTSVERNLDVDDSIEMIIAGKKTKLTVAAISENKSKFYNDNSTDINMIVPYEFMAKELGIEGKYNFVLADNAKGSVEDSIKDFNKANSNYEADELFSEESIKDATSQFSQILYFMMAIVVFMSSIIIYSSFKLIVTERMSIIGTFLSQGATKRVVKLILYLESLCYGIVGAIIGTLLGVGALNIINRAVSPLAEYGIYEKVKINYLYVILAVVFSILLSLISAVLPISKIRKLQVKEVILNNVSFSMKIGWGKFFVGVAIIVACLLGAFIDKDWTITVSPILILGAYIGVILMYPKTIDVFSKVLYKIFRGKSKSLVFSLNNLRTSKVLLGNTTLIIISIISILMISSIGTSMTGVVTEAYEKLNYDINITGVSTIRENSELIISDEIVKKLKEVDGYEKDSAIVVRNCYGTLDGKEDDIGFGIAAANLDNYLDYNKYVITNDEEKETYNKLKETKDGILVSNNIKKKYNLKAGKYYKIKIDEITRKVKVVGFFNARLFNNGNFAIISKNTLEDLYGLRGGTSITLNTTKSPKEFKKDIKSIKEDFGVNISTRAEDTKNNTDQNAQLVTILNIFNYMAMIIASLGVLNNIVIGFLQRKRELAVLSSVGMSKSNRNKMIVFESVITVFWASIFSIPGSMLVVKLISKFTRMLNLEFDAKLDFESVPYYIIVALVIVLFATIPVLFKSKKLSIINELKYE